MESISNVASGLVHFIFKSEPKFSKAAKGCVSDGNTARTILLFCFAVHLFICLFSFVSIFHSHFSYYCPWQLRQCVLCASFYLCLLKYILVCVLAFIFELYKWCYCVTGFMLLFLSEPYCFFFFECHFIVPRSSPGSYMAFSCCIFFLFN